MSIFEELRRRNVIRVAALYVVVSWLILQVAELLFAAFELPTWSMRLLIAILLLGLPVALVFSWIFELTPDGLQRESQIDESSSRHVAARRINIVIVVLLIIAVATLTIERIVPATSTDVQTTRQTTTELPERSIAVLPFVNISDDPENEYFSEGLSEELLNMLAGVEQLRVTARTSSFSFKDKDVDIRTIGQQLNVANVLEGSVRKSDNQVRITAQLINTESGYHLWSATYDRMLDDIFAVQDEIAKAVVDALRVTLLDEAPRARQTTPQAFSAYLHGLHFYSQRTTDGYDKTLQYLQQTINIDAQYVPAWTLLAATHSNMALTGQQPYDKAHQMALAAAESALDIDADFALANSARAWLAMTYEHDFAASAAFFRRAVSLAPGNSVILGNRAVLARTLGHLDTAIDLTRRSIELNPISSTGYVNLSDQLFRAGRPLEAAEAARKAVELTPGNQTAHANLSLSYLLAEQLTEAIAAADRSNWEFAQLFIKTLAYHALGRYEKSNAAQADFVDGYADSSAFYIASTYAWKNDADTAFEWLQRAIDEGQPTLGIRTEPLLSSLHDDARWNVILEKRGLSDEQVAAIRF